METTTIKSDTDRVNAILAMVGDSADPAVDISLKHRKRLEDAKRAAYFKARGEGKTAEEADTAGHNAAAVEIQLIMREEMATPAPIQAPAKDPPPVPFAPIPVVPVPRPTTPSMPNIEAGQVDADRNERDLAAAKVAGFAPKDPIFERGSQIQANDVNKARRSRVEHDKKPLVIDATTELIAKVRDEQRRIVVVKAGNIGMDSAGNVTGTGCRINGVDVDDLAVPVTRAAFGSMVSRMGYSGADYLSRLPTAKRAQEVNWWRGVIAGADPALAQEVAKIAEEQHRRELVTADDELAFRVRTKRDGTDEAFAVVSPEYAPFDCDVIADAIRRACLSSPVLKTDLADGEFVADLSQARGRVTYDGAKSRFEVMFHSDIKPESFVAGEFFKAGVLIRSDDTGSGACRVVPVIWQALCSNMIILDICRGDEISIRHVGSIEKLTRAFEKAFRSALGKIAHFMRAWGYACKETVLDATARAYAKCPADAEKALPGLFNGLLTKGGVTIPGKRKEVVNALVEKWNEDQSGAKIHGLTRASLVNALTRFAHTIAIDDPWAEDEIQRDAGKLLFNTSDPIPYVSLDEVAETTSAMARAN